MLSQLEHLRVVVQVKLLVLVSLLKLLERVPSEKASTRPTLQGLHRSLFSSLGMRLLLLTHCLGF